MFLSSIFGNSKNTSNPKSGLSPIEQTILANFTKTPSEWVCSLNGKDPYLCFAANLALGVRFIIRAYPDSSEAGLSTGFSITLPNGDEIFSEEFCKAFGQAAWSIASLSEQERLENARKAAIKQLEQIFSSKPR